MRAWVLELDDAVVAVAGVYRLSGHLVAFSDIAADVPKLTIWRCAKAFPALVNAPMTCLVQAGSERFLERLGWKMVGSTEDGNIYQWLHCSEPS